MKKFKVELKAEYTVEFLDEKLAQDYFIDGEFAEWFWKPNDLDELAGTLAIQFHNESGISTKFVEGYGEFKYDSTARNYVCEYPKFGKIRITEEEDIYDDWCYEVTE